MLEIRRRYYEGDLVERLSPHLNKLRAVCEMLCLLEYESRAQLVAAIRTHLSVRNGSDEHLADAFIKALESLYYHANKKGKPSQGPGRPTEDRRNIVITELARLYERHVIEANAHVPGAGPKDQVKNPPFRESDKDHPIRLFVLAAAIAIDPELSEDEVRKAMKIVGRTMSSSGPGLSAQRKIQRKAIRSRRGKISKKPDKIPNCFETFGWRSSALTCNE